MLLSMHPSVPRGCAQWCADSSAYYTYLYMWPIPLLVPLLFVIVYAPSTMCRLRTCVAAAAFVRVRACWRCCFVFEYACWVFAPHVCVLSLRVSDNARL